ncbi:MAG: formate dehydrogenase accessory sulfurtransferase FdhD [Fibrobacteria bacterium]|nr:formate dehydrogenase accessory sulfurtransferase FdhD [Fibrobacteria bacterium]
MKELSSDDMQSIIETIKVSHTGVETVCKTLAAEVPFSVCANGTELATLMSSPSDLKELAYGFLLSSGFVASQENIIGYHFNKEQWTAEVKLKHMPEKSEFGKKLYSAGCGSAVIYFKGSDLPERLPAEKGMRVAASKIHQLLKWFKEHSRKDKLSGGLHTACMSLAGEQPDNIYYDVGRHNAVDKVLGSALCRDFNFEQLIILSTGRISSEIVYKAGRAGVPMIICLGTPTRHAVHLSSTMGITLIGNAKGNHFLVYTEQERVSV